MATSPTKKKERKGGGEGGRKDGWTEDTVGWVTGSAFDFTKTRSTFPDAPFGGRA